MSPRSLDAELKGLSKHRFEADERVAAAAADVERAQKALLEAQANQKSAVAALEPVEKWNEEIRVIRAAAKEKRDVAEKLKKEIGKGLEALCNRIRHAIPEDESTNLRNRLATIDKRIADLSEAVGRQEREVSERDADHQKAARQALD